jgi:hypothetical protein
MGGRSGRRGAETFAISRRSRRGSARLGHRRRPRPPGFLPDALAGQLIAAARAVVEPLRAYGAYAAALPPQPGDDAAAELLRYLGRDPRWSAVSSSSR